MRKEFSLTDADVISDPISKGSGMIIRYSKGYNIEDDYEAGAVDENIHGFVSFVVQKDNDLFTKIKGFPLRAQKMPLIATIAGEKFTIQLRSIKKMNITEDNILITEAAYSALDNLQFLEAMTRERWLWSDHVKKTNES